ncbi:MAG TPA: hypothetical protein VL689_04255 [Paraburkholderia sp.]|jgi:hypothetical protein|nr:hypothetical protein [Paraburkholderia sp.]
MTIACESANVRTATAPVGSAGSAGFAAGFASGSAEIRNESPRLLFQPSTDAAACEPEVPFPLATRDGSGSAKGVISRRAFAGRRQVCRDARAVQ